MLQDLLYQEDSFGVFLLVTVLLGGGAAWLAGRAIAQTWRPWWSLVPYMLILGIAIRFFHFALFDGTLLSPHYYAVDTGVALLLAGLGFRVTRTAQMRRQYGFLDTTVPRSAARQDAAP
jgi:NO-binding membrane sensor protein with MHYT domain